MYIDQIKKYGLYKFLDIEAIGEIDLVIDELFDFIKRKNQKELEVYPLLSAMLGEYK